MLENKEGEAKSKCRDRRIWWYYEKFVRIKNEGIQRYLVSKSPLPYPRHCLFDWHLTCNRMFEAIDDVTGICC